MSRRAEATVSARFCIFEGGRILRTLTTLMLRFGKTAKSSLLDFVLLSICTIFE